MTALADSFVFVLIDAAIKATVILGLAATAAWLSRHTSASFRHLIWALGLGCVLFLPLFSQALPQWHITVKTSVHVRQKEPLPLPVPSAVIPKSDTDNSVPLHALPSATPVPSTVEPAAIPPSPAPSVPAASIGLLAISWTAWALIIWAAGALLIMIKLARSLRCLKAIAKASIDVSEGAISDVKSAAMKTVGLGRPIMLRLSSAAPRLSVPLTWGTLNSVIVLPAQATEWSQDKLHAALLHEMAHVRRSDWLLQTLACVACALYWFNPLVWFAARRMRAESETACDDLVLAAGVPAPDYARHLLDIALQAQNGRRVSAGAVAMAQSPQIEGRLRTILATGLKRESVGRRMAVAILATVLLLALPLAALRVAALVPRVPVPAADQLQLYSDFTLVYAVTIRNQQTQARLLREYQQLRQNYQQELKQDPYFQPVPEDFYVPFTTYQSRHMRPRHVVITVSAHGKNFLYQTVEDGDSYSQVYDGHNTQTFGNGHVGSVSFERPPVMENCPIPAVGLPYIHFLKNVTSIPSVGEPQTWQASILDVGTVQGADQPFYLDGLVHATSEDGNWKVLDTDNTEQQWQFLQHQRFQGLWIASQMRLTNYDLDGPLPPTSQYRSFQAAMDWFKTVRKSSRVCEFHLLSASDTPFDPAALVKRQPPRLAAASQLRDSDDYYLQEALHLRYHLQSWAEDNKALLQQMGRAAPTDRTFAAKVDRSLGTLPFPLWQAGGVMWDGDPRVGHNGQKPLFVAERLGQQNEGTFRDFEIARSPKNGVSHTVLWASGRITRNTLQEATKVENQQEIVPAFFGEDGTNNMAEGEPATAPNGQFSPPEEQQLKPVYGFRRYTSPPLPDGTRFTFLYPAYYNTISQEHYKRDNEFWYSHLDCSGTQPVPWAAVRGQTAIAYYLHGKNGASWLAPHEEFCSIVVGNAGSVAFTAGTDFLRKDTRWIGQDGSHHAFSITDRRTHLRFLLTHEDRYIPALFNQTDPVISSSFRILPPTRNNQSKDNWTEVTNVPLQPSTLTKAAPAVSDVAHAQTDTAAAHVALGDQLHQIGRPRDAIREFRRAVELEPDNAEAQYELANALYTINEKVVGRVTTFHEAPPAILDEAIFHMRKAVALQPSNAQWHSTMGTYLSNRGRDAEAVVEYKMALHLLPAIKPINLDRLPNSPLSSDAHAVFDIQWLLGGSFLKTNHYDEAVVHYQQALGFRPQSDWVLLGLGDALNGIGRHTEARAAWKKVVALDGTKFYYGRKAQARLAGH